MRKSGRPGYLDFFDDCDDHQHSRTALIALSTTGQARPTHTRTEALAPPHTLKASRTTMDDSVAGVRSCHNRSGYIDRDGGSSSRGHPHGRSDDDDHHDELQTTQAPARPHNHHTRTVLNPPPSSRQPSDATERCARELDFPGLAWPALNGATMALRVGSQLTKGPERRRGARHVLVTRQWRSSPAPPGPAARERAPSAPHEAPGPRAARRRAPRTPARPRGGGGGRTCSRLAAGRARAASVRRRPAAQRKRRPRARKAHAGRTQRDF